MGQMRNKLKLLDSLVAEVRNLDIFGSTAESWNNKQAKPA